MYKADTLVRYIKGLGPTRSHELNKLGIYTVLNLLERQPLSYIFPGGISIAEIKEGQVVIKAEIIRIFRAGHGAIAKLDDGTHQCKAQWFHNPWVLSSLHPGMTAIFWGHYKGGVLQQPKWSTCEAFMKDVYGGQYGVHHTTIRAALKEVLDGYGPWGDIFGMKLPTLTDGKPRPELFRSFHFPQSKEEQRQAEHDLKKDEALQLQLALAEKRKRGEQHESTPIWYVSNKSKKIRSYFPYIFTEDQQRTLGQTLGDMACAHRPMSRLIHGEVGSGKTAVAFYAAMLTALNGKRTLILCPTTILAQQHYDTLRGMGWDDVALFATKDDWDAHIVIGTHVMLNNKYLMQKSSLVIIDEFQKFGVEQRAKIQKHNPHLLLMSATPIPRSLAMTVFGDLDVSTIRQLPIKRGTIITKQVLSDRKEAMYEIIGKELAKGHQAYVIYPRISGDEGVVSAECGYEDLCERFDLKGYIVDLLTGKQSTDIKKWALQEFREGETDILVSTIIAEVGLDVPNATVMVVEGADRFGLSQLHQLRGRVCRSTSTTFCFLVSETSNSTSIARLEVIEKTNDGFEIAEEDLRLRGAGELFSTKQHGLPDLKFISLVDDFDLLQEAKELVASGSVGEGPKAMMRIKYEGLLQFGGVT